MPEPLEIGRAEDVRGLVVVLGDALHAGDDDDEDERGGPPQLGDEDGQEHRAVVLVGQPRDGVEPEDVAQRVQVAAVGEDREPDEPGGKVRDRQRDGPQVEVQPVTPGPGLQQEGHDECQGELQRQQDDNEQQGVAHRRPERRVGGHPLDVRGGRPVRPHKCLLDSRDHGPPEQQRHVDDRRRDQQVCRRDRPLALRPGRCRSRHLSPPCRSRPP